MDGELVRRLPEEREVTLQGVRCSETVKGTWTKWSQQWSASAGWEGVQLQDLSSWDKWEGKVSSALLLFLLGRAACVSSSTVSMLRWQFPVFSLFFFPLEVCFLLWLKAQVRLLCLTSAPSHCAFAICCLQRLKSGREGAPTASLRSLCCRDLCYTMLFLASPSRGGELVFPPSPGEDASLPANNWRFLMTRVSTGYWGKGWSISSPGLAAWSSFGLSSYSLPCGSVCKVLCKPICHISWSICFFGLGHVFSWRADGG